MMAVIQISAKDMESLLDKHSFVLLEFWAIWCGPCKSFKKVVEEIAPRYPDCLFASIDIDAEPELAEEFEIRSVPSVMIIKNRVVVYADSGALSTQALEGLLEQAQQL